MLKVDFSSKILIIIIISLIFLNFYYFPENILSWDVFGYYSYLPMIFIYDNWGLQDMSIPQKIVEQYHNSSTLYQFFVAPTGFWMMRYPIGLSYLYSPFFFIGHLVALISKYPADGYSFPYQISILICGIFYSILGFIFLRKILRYFFNDIVTGLVLLILFFGTNYLITCCVNGNNAASHNYLFTLYVLLIYFTIQWHETLKFKYLAGISIIIAIQVLCRPSELVSMLIPVLWGIGTKYSLKEKLNLFYQHFNQIFIGILIFIALCLPQIIYWKIIGGSFLFNTYAYSNPGEGIDLDNSHLLEVLFSFRKGWLIYTPIMIFAILGTILTLFKKEKFSISISTYFLLNLYIISCWTIWWNASSFSQRFLVQSYAALSLPLAQFIDISFNNNKIKIPVLLLLIVFTLLNLFQSWQYQNGIIHESGMTKEAYLATFLKTEKPQNFKDLLHIDLLNYTDPELKKIDSTKYFKSKEWTIEYNKTPYGLMLDSNNIFSPPFTKVFNDLTSNDHVKLLVKAITKNSNNPTKNPLTLVITLQHDNKNYGYYAQDISNESENLKNWDTTSTTYLNPPIRNPKKDHLSIYFWLRGKQQAYIKRLKIEVWEKK